MKLTPYQQNLMSQYYKNALELAGYWKRKFPMVEWSIIYDACTHALLKAARTYDKEKGEFEAVLWLSCKNEVHRIFRYREAKVRKGVALMSFDFPYYDNNDETTLHELIGTHDKYHFFDNEYLGYGWSQLDDREKRIMNLYFYKEMKQSDIGKLFGVSQMSVSRIIRKGLAKMKAYYEQVG